MVGFTCSRCGACCMDVIPSLPRDGNGRCTNLAPDNRTCTVYESRPIVCRVEDLGRFLGIDPDKWASMNVEGCRALHRRVHGSELEEDGSICSHGTST